MKSVACFACLGALALAGCNSSLPPSAQGDSATNAPIIGSGQPAQPGPTGQAADSDSRVVATINPTIAGDPQMNVTLGELMPALIKAHGLTTLLQLVELDLTKQEAARRHITVTPEEIAHEREVTLGHLFQQTDDHIQAEIADAQSAHDDKRVKELLDQKADEHAVLLRQFLDNQHYAESEFDTAVEINAYLRKFAEPDAAKLLTPEVLQAAFYDQYGARRRVRYIQLDNMQQVAEAQRRLSVKHEDFGDVAEQMSTNVKSRAMRGECPPFARNAPGIPQNFSDAAFDLKEVGQVSDPVEIGNSIFLIKFEEKLPPIAVKFDEVKDVLRAKLAENLVQQDIKDIREKLGRLAMQEMKIKDPIMSQQFEDRQAEKEAEIRDQQHIKEELNLEHERYWKSIEASTQPATKPAGPATQP